MYLFLKYLCDIYVNMQTNEYLGQNIKTGLMNFVIIDTSNK